MCSACLSKQNKDILPRGHELRRARARIEQKQTKKSFLGQRVLSPRLFGCVASLTCVSATTQYSLPKSLFFSLATTGGVAGYSQPMIRTPPGSPVPAVTTPVDRASRRILGLSPEREPLPEMTSTALPQSGTGNTPIANYTL